MKVHVYVAPLASTRVAALLQKLATSISNSGSAPVVQRSGSPKNLGDVLLTYGAGGTYQRGAIATYRQLGKPVITLDLGYWSRADAGAANCFRWSLNGHHPSSELVARAGDCFEPETQAAVSAIRSVSDPSGPVIFCLMGRKSRSAFPSAFAEERELLARLRTKYGDRLVVRPKPSDVKGAQRPGDQPLAQFSDVLVGAALVASHSSNASVEAAQSGVPFVSLAGVARSYSSETKAAHAESVIRRAGFFHISERMIAARTAWPRLRSLL